MSERVLSATYLAKAGDSLVGADSEYANGRYTNCANRCYYACFQAAIAALQDAGIRSPSLAGDWSHEAAQATFAGQLSRRRKRYPTELGDALSRLFAERPTTQSSMSQRSKRNERCVARTRSCLSSKEFWRVDSERCIVRSS